MIRFDYYVVDDFNDVWNEEPLPTFNQACQFRGMIKSLINRTTNLRIVSFIRGEKIDKKIEVKQSKKVFLNSDF